MLVWRNMLVLQTKTERLPKTKKHRLEYHNRIILLITVLVLHSKIFTLHIANMSLLRGVYGFFQVEKFFGSFFCYYFDQNQMQRKYGKTMFVESLKILNVLCLLMFYPYLMLYAFALICLFCNKTEQKRLQFQSCRSDFDYRCSLRAHTAYCCMCR